MLRIIHNIIDRCFFTIVFILGVQLPEFIIQYKQRLSGHFTEAKLHLVQFQAIADQHYHGDLSAMIIKYKTNLEPSIMNTAEVINQLIHRVSYLQQQLNIVTNNDYMEQVFNIIFLADRAIIQNTLVDFSMAIPLEINALTTGVALAIISLLTKELLVHSIRYLSHKLWANTT
jgi:hypothetical protein